MTWATRALLSSLLLLGSAWSSSARAESTRGVETLREPAGGMVRVLGGPVWLGSSPDDVLAAAASCAGEPLAHRCSEQTFANELVRRRVNLPGFWLDRTEVRVADYARCVAARRCAPAEYGAGAERLERANYPVSFVTYWDAEAYCRFRGARLPSEAEFERAARGANARTYPWGELYNAHVVNHGRLGILRNDASDGFAELAPVGSFPEGRTPDGILDLSGNVAEWTRDIYRERSDEAPSDDLDNAPRAVRGGSFLSGAAWLRGAARESAPPNTRRAELGFRCARSAGERP